MQKHECLHIVCRHRVALRLRHNLSWGLSWVAWEFVQWGLSTVSIWNSNVSQLRWPTGSLILQPLSSYISLGFLESHPVLVHPNIQPNTYETQVQISRVSPLHSSLGRPQLGPLFSPHSESPALFQTLPRAVIWRVPGSELFCLGE